MKRWSITWGDKTWTDADARGAHLALVSELSGDTWDAISPWSGPRALQTWIVAFVATENGGDLQAALAAVYAAPLDQFIDALAEPADADAVTV
jgi:hypothetical protein